MGPTGANTDKHGAGTDRLTLLYDVVQSRSVHQKPAPCGAPTCTLPVVHWVLPYVIVHSVRTSAASPTYTGLTLPNTPWANDVVYRCVLLYFMDRC